MLSKQYLEPLDSSIKSTLSLAKQHNVECEVSGTTNVGGTINVRMQNIDSLEFNNSNHISITVYSNKQKATVNTTELNQQSLRNAFAKALSIAKFASQDPYAGLADPNLMTTNIIDLDLYHPENIQPEFAVDLAKRCEAAAFAHNKNIRNSDGAVFEYNASFTALGNSHGFTAAYPATNYSLYCAPIAEQSGSMQRDYEFTTARNLNNLLNAEYIGQKSAQKTIARLGAKQLTTGDTKILFTPAIAAQLFNYLTIALYGSKIATQSSFLLDKLNAKLLPDFITMIDQPLLKMGLNSCCFDSDGVATKQRDIVTAGRLNTYLLDNYFAKKLNLQTTGHADGIHNLFIQNTNHSKLNLANLKDIYPKIKHNCTIDIFSDYAELIKTMQTGLIVTDTIGHGVNLVTGDYSKGACGFWVENGKIAYPVEEITIAGNLITMFNNILATGQDYNYQNNIITGSLLIDNITIAGH